MRIDERKIELTVFDMWKSVSVLKAILIFVSFTVLSFGNMTVFIALGIVVLLLACYMAFRQGQGIGHEACSVSSSIRHIGQQPGRADQIDDKMYRQAFSVSNGVKSILAGGLIGYLVNSVYIACMLLKAPEGVQLGTRMASFVVSIGYWPIVVHWHELFNVLTPDIVAVLMAGPFLLPVCQFAGYLQGPKLWEKTEKAMAEGKRRAKARSRIGRKKNTPKIRKPEI